MPICGEITGHMYHCTEDEMMMKYFPEEYARLHANDHLEDAIYNPTNNEEYNPIVEIELQKHTTKDKEDFVLDTDTGQIFWENDHSIKSDDKKVELNTKVELNAKAALNVASNNLSGNLSPKDNLNNNLNGNHDLIHDIIGNKMIEVHASGENVVNNDFHSPCKEGEKTCIGYDNKDRPNEIVCKSKNENC
ncbi:MAG: hypothetical protein OEZ01_01165 [Candidatus Heimdallarchaeota archaeon]|nr:hypothetical protein [Candidatus Heimdallarchaeota archaeon]